MIKNLFGQYWILRAIATGTSGSMKNIPKEKFLSIEYLLPPTKAEQQAIADALSDADALIDSLEKLIAKKRLIKQGAMQELLTGKRRLPEFVEPWELVEVASLGYSYGGLTGKSKNDFDSGNSFYIPFMNIISNTVIKSNFLGKVSIQPQETQNLVEQGDLFFYGSSETPDEVGLCSVLLEKLERTYLIRFCFGFRPKSEFSCDGLFLAYFFRSKPGREIFTSLAQGATRYNLSKSAFLKAKALLPGVEEQKAISSLLFDLDSKISALETKLAKVRLIKQGMMRELLTGRIRLV